MLEVKEGRRIRVLRELKASLHCVRLCLKNKVTEPQILSLNLITVLFIGPALILLPNVSSGFCLDCFLSVFYDYFSVEYLISWHVLCENLQCSIPPDELFLVSLILLFVFSTGD